MPAEEIYQPRVMPQAAAPIPLADAADYGAGVGQALGQAGEQLHADRIRQFQIERRVNADREQSDFAHRFALHRQNMDDVVREIRANPTSPDYGEHLKRVEQADDAGRAALLDGITETGVRRQAEQQLDSYRTQLTNSEGDFAEGQRVAKTVLDRGKANDVSQNRIRQGVDAQTYGQELQLNHDQIYGMHGLNPVQKDKLWADYQQGAGVAFVDHTIDTNPKAALGLLDAGAFNEVLKPEQIEQLRNGAMVEIRRQDAAVAHAANVAKSELDEQIATAKAKASQGIDVSADLPTLIQGAQAAGDTSNVVELQGLARDSAFAKVWNGQTPIAREARIGQLRRIIDSKGGSAKDPYGEFPIVMPTAAEMARPDWKREDGSTKGTGFLGLRKRPDGGVSSELSVSFGDVLGGRDIPTMVPGLTPAEVKWLLTTPEDQIAQKLPEDIKRKAIAHALERDKQGLSPFKQPGEPAYSPPGNGTENEQAELHWLESKRGALDSQFNNDRVGFVMANGQPNEQPPALDPADPTTFVARAQWARTAARTYGQMDMLSKQEREALAGQLARNDAGYSDVTDALAQFGGSAARQAAREVAPNDKSLQQLVLLPESYRKIARDGRAALQGKQVTLPEETSENVDPGVVNTSRGFDRALAAVPQADRNGIRDVAKDIAAKFLHDKGGELDERLWAQALDMALGARGTGGQKRGGLGSWNDMKFLVPDDLTAQQFTDKVFGYIRANPKNGPVNPDGSPANLRNARPVAVGPGIYQFMVGDRPVLAKGRDGTITSPWQFTIGGNR